MKQLSSPASSSLKSTTEAEELYGTTSTGST